MKNLISVLISIFSILLANATTYYFSSTGGDDTRTSVQAQSSATPWKTIAKLNSVMSGFASGDVVAFKRGDIFTTTGLVVNRTDLTFKDYGVLTAPNPIIEGFTTVSGWTSIGSGRWQVTVPGGLSSCNSVLFDGAFQQMGKMPKGNAGYYIASAVATNSITSTGISGLSTFVGGEIVWRPFPWVLWRGTLLTQSSTTVTFNPFPSTGGGGTEQPQVNYGFFFQNHPNCCTQLGEWAYNGTSHILTMFFGSDAPTAHIIKVATTDNLITASSTITGTIFNNLTLQGGNSSICNMVGQSNITFSACNIWYSGLYGVFANGISNNWTFSNCDIGWVTSIGIREATGGTGWLLNGNFIHDIAMWAGMGGSGESAQYSGTITKSNTTITNNIYKRIGYLAIFWDGANNLIQYNYVDSCDLVKADAGGIYCHGPATGGSSAMTGSRIINNVITNIMSQGIGAASYSVNDGQGIYADDGASDFECAYNTIAFCGHGGVYFHAAHEIDFHDNILYDNGWGIRFFNDEGTMANLKIHKNISFAKTNTQYVLLSGSTVSSSWFAISDTNRWCRPIGETNSFNVNSTLMSLSGWRTSIGKDANSVVTPWSIASPSEIRFEVNATASPISVSMDGNTYLDVFNASQSGTITLQPFTSIILKLSISGGNIAPVSNAGTNQTITAPATSVTLSGISSNDPDGSISAYAWSKISGPASYSIATPALVTTDVTGLVPGIYLFQLKVTDNVGTTASSTVQVIVNAAATVYYNIAKSQYFTRNNCTGGLSPTTVLYTVAASTYSSTISQADANNKAQNDINLNGQNYANMNGSCLSCNWWWKFLRLHGCHF